MPVNLGTGTYLRLTRNDSEMPFLTHALFLLYKLPPASRTGSGNLYHNYYILIPVLLRLSTKPFCAYRYRMINGTITIRVPVASIQFV